MPPQEIDAMGADMQAVFEADGDNPYFDGFTQALDEKTHPRNILLAVTWLLPRFGPTIARAADPLAS